MNVPQTPKVLSEIRVASAAMDPDAAHLNAVSVRPWGKYGPDDLRNLEQSLSDTLSAQLAATPVCHESRLDIHVVVRRHVVSVSNTAGAVLACVAWAAASPAGSIIHHEQFYAWDAVYLVGTIGRMKDSVHKAIVRRVATTSWALAADAVPAWPRTTAFANTSTSFEEAVSRLPHTLVSLGEPALMPVPGAHVLNVAGLVTPTGASRVPWEQANVPDAFDWQEYLDKLHGGP
jgi:hypothetical protein